MWPRWRRCGSSFRNCCCTRIRKTRTHSIGNWPEDAPHVAITGDTIFSGSMAEGKQSTDLLKQKVREQIFTLPEETLLCPGHGPLTTVALEKANNPFF